MLVKGLEGKHIVSIASGHQHSIAMDKDGYVWTWGHGGLGRLGHGEQKDCLVPRLVDAFTSDNRIMRATKIACGATCSMGKLVCHLISLSGQSSTPYFSDRRATHATAIRKIQGHW